MAWDKTIPTVTDSPCNSVTSITDNWTAWTTWLGKEHYNMASALSGYHKPGIVSVLPTGSYAAMTATTPGTGALWWDTTYGGLNVYSSGGDWEPITKNYYSRIVLKKSTQALTTGWNLLTWDDPSIDGLDEYTYATNVLTIEGEGYYFIKAQAQFQAGTNMQKGIAVYKDGTLFSQSGNYGSNVITVELDDIIYCAASTTLAFYAYINGTTLDLNSANASIVRLS